MKLSSLTIAYKEERFIIPHLRQYPNQVSERLVLNSTNPWQGERVEDTTGNLAELAGATVIRHDWDSEEAQRNAGMDYLYDSDWIIVLDPDEFLTTDGWLQLLRFLKTAPGQAYVCEKQITYYKDGIIDPPEDYKQIIAVRPGVRFIDKRVVDCAWSHAPVTLHHLSWKRTNEEIWNKITHYAHAHEFDTRAWYDNIWLSNQTENLHPLTPPSLKRLVPGKLPADIEELF